MSKSVLYAANSSTQSVSTGSVVNFGSIVRRYGRNCDLQNGTAIVRGEGYYSVDCNFTFATAAAGTVLVTLYKNGLAIPGATTSFSTTANAETNSVTIPAMFRHGCCAETSITAVVTGTATLNSASIRVVKE